MSELLEEEVVDVKEEEGYSRTYYAVKEILREDPSWMKRGQCYGLPTALFFPDRGAKKTKGVIAKFCNVCSVRVSCLNYALDNHSKGIHGGTNEKGREKIRRQMRK